MAAHASPKSSALRQIGRFHDDSAVLLQQGTFGVAYLRQLTVDGTTKYVVSKEQVETPSDTFEEPTADERRQLLAHKAEIWRHELACNARVANCGRHPAFIEVLGIRPRGSIVMSYAEGGDFFDWLSTWESTLKAPDLDNMARQLFGGLAWLNASGVVHRDIKPTNVFLRTSGEDALKDPNAVKIGDFGSAAQVDGSGRVADAHRAGATPYTHPDVFSNDQRWHAATTHALICEGHSAAMLLLNAALVKLILPFEAARRTHSSPWWSSHAKACIDMNRLSTPLAALCLAAVVPQQARQSVTTCLQRLSSRNGDLMSDGSLAGMRQKRAAATLNDWTTIGATQHAAEAVFPTISTGLTPAQMAQFLAEAGEAPDTAFSFATPQQQPTTKRSASSSLEPPGQKSRRLLF